MKIYKTINIDNIKIVHSDLGLDMYCYKGKRLTNKAIWTNSLGVKALLEWNKKTPLPLGDMYARVDNDGLTFYGDSPYYMTRIDMLIIKQYEKFLLWLSMDKYEWIRYERREKLSKIFKDQISFGSSTEYISHNHNYRQYLPAKHHTLTPS